MSGIRKWPLALLFVDMAFGLFVSVLMTWHHDTQLYGTSDEKGELIGCVESATVNCDIVNTSDWSELLGIPIATLSFAVYATVLVLTVLALKGRRSALSGLVVAGVLGVLGSAFLFYQSKIELGYVCAWCLRLYAVNTAILLLALLAGRASWKLDDEARGTLVFSGGALLALLLLSAGGERIYRRSLLGDTPTALAAADISASAKADPAGPPPPRSFTVTTEENREAMFSLDADDAWKGKADSPVAVVEFADLQCGYCKRASSELSRLYAAYGDRALFVFKHFPMNPDCNPGVKTKKHREACRAATAAVCAKEQGHFWDFHDLTFKNQHQLDADHLRTYAEKVGLDLAAFDRCTRDPATVDQIRHDATVGSTLDIHGTPRIFINGKLYRSGSSAEAMARAIELALGATPQEASSGAAGLHETEAAIQPIPADVPEMRRVEYGGLAFSIDTFEAAIENGKAVVGKHKIPAIRASWFDGKAACEAALKRMCTEEEWVTACQNARAVDEDKNGQFGDDMIEGTAYPYGDFHEDERCWDGKEGDRTGESWRPVYTGEMPGCVSANGVYDLTGNVEEWVGDKPEHAVLIGGSYDTSEDHARCYRRNDTFGAGYASLRTGFRCCRD